MLSERSRPLTLPLQKSIRFDFNKIVGHLNKSTMTESRSVIVMGRVKVGWRGL